MVVAGSNSTVEIHSSPDLDSVFRDIIMARAIPSEVDVIMYMSSSMHWPFELSWRSQDTNFRRIHSDRQSPSEVYDIIFTRVYKLVALLPAATARSASC